MFENFLILGLAFLTIFLYDRERIPIMKLVFLFFSITLAIVSLSIPNYVLVSQKTQNYYTLLSTNEMLNYTITNYTYAPMYPSYFGSIAYGFYGLLIVYFFVFIYEVFKRFI